VDVLEQNENKLHYIRIGSCWGGKDRVVLENKTLEELGECRRRALQEGQILRNLARETWDDLYEPLAASCLFPFRAPELARL